jgi:hypothetical protein
MSGRAAALPVALLLLAGCATTPPSAIPRDDWIVAVKSARVTSRFPWFTRFAHHTWIDVKRGDESSWLRVEVRGRGRGVLVRPLTASDARNDSWFGGRPVHLLELITGEPARLLAEQIETVALAERQRYVDDYLIWPGPNSNTFVADLAEALPDLAFVFDANAVGKDFAWIDAGRTSSKTGVRLDTPIVGAAVGLREGIELHVIGLTLGVRLWPPGLALPFLPTIPQGFAVEFRDPATPDAPPASGYDREP